MTNVRRIVDIRSSEKNEVLGEALIAAMTSGKTKFPHRVTLRLDFDTTKAAQDTAENYIMQVMKLRKRYGWNGPDVDRRIYLDASASFSLSYVFRHEEHAMIFKLAMSAHPEVLEVKYEQIS